MLGVLAQPTVVAVDPPPPMSQHRAERRDRTLLGLGVAATVASAATLGSTAVMLWGYRRDAAHEEAARHATERDECRRRKEDFGSDVSCGPYVIITPQAHIRRVGFRGWPLVPAAAGIGLAVGAGHLLGRARPAVHSAPQLYVGGTLLVSGGLSFVVGRLRKPDQGCLDEPCVDRWFQTNASLYMAGVAAMGVGGFLIAHGAASDRHRVRPELVAGRDRAMAGFSLQF